MCIDMRKFLQGLALSLLWAVPAHALAPVQAVKIANGLTAWVIEDHSLPIVTIRATFTDAGGATDPAGKEGLARLAAVLLDEGAGDYNALSFQRALEDKAIKWSASASEDTLSLSVETLSEHTYAALQLMGLALSKARFDADAVARIKAQQLASMAQGEQDPGYIADTVFRAELFGAHAYASPALGYGKSVASVTPADLKRYAATRLTRANTYLAVVGDVTPKQLQDGLTAHWAGLPKGKTQASVTEATPRTAPLRVQVTRDLPQTVVLFGAGGPLRSDPDYLATYVLNDRIGGSGLDSKLIDALREKRGLVYYASTALDPMLHAGVLRGQFATRADQAEQAIAVLQETLTALRDKGLTAQELAETKQYLTGAFPVMLDSNDKLAGYLTNMQIYRLGRDYLEKRNALVEAVTLEKINALAAKWFDPARLIIVSVGPKASANAGVKQ